MSLGWATGPQRVEREEWMACGEWGQWAMQCQARAQPLSTATALYPFCRDICLPEGLQRCLSCILLLGCVGVELVWGVHRQSGSCRGAMLGPVLVSLLLPPVHVGENRESRQRSCAGVLGKGV